MAHCISAACAHPAGPSWMARRRGGPTPRSNDGRRAGPAWSNLEMPNGVFWLDRAAHNHDIVYGQNFVLQRPKRGGPGLVLSPQLTSLNFVNPQDAPLVTAVKAGPACLARLNDLPLAWDVEISDYSYVEDDCAAAGSDSGPQPACTSFQIVLYRQHEEEDESEAAHAPQRARRSRAVRFTCNRCGATTTRRVNPHAWVSGSVFARCGGCEVIHKLTDNLKLFHELSGSVFPPSPRLRTLRIPPGLPQRPAAPFFSLSGDDPLAQD